MNQELIEFCGFANCPSMMPTDQSNSPKVRTDIKGIASTFNN
ncbi:MAG: hypothetical protein AAFQ89_09070 [Cyanobacteria bacterium J06626_18]